jgi:putative ABC transport system permease protein
MSPLERKLLRDLWHLRGQVIAIALVVACGVAAFVAMRSTYLSLLTTQETYYASYRFANVFAQLKRAPESLASRIREIPGVAAAQTRVVADITLDVPGLNEPARGKLISIPERPAPMLNDLCLQRGRYVEPGKRDEIIVSGAFAGANNLQPGDTLDGVINGRWQRLRVVGVALSPEYVYEIRGGDIFPDSRRFGVLWMSRDALGPAFNMEGAFNDVAVSFAPGAVEADVIERLDMLLARYGGWGAYGREDQISHRFISNEIAELKVTGTFIPAVFLTVTAFLIHLALSRLIATQREQIALLKAFGYSNATVGLHYLKMGLVAVSCGSLIGIAVGWYFGFKVTALYTEFFRFPLLRFGTDPQIIMTALLISYGAATLGALVAVRGAVRLPPAEAMRPEPPARFRAGFLERLGPNRLLSPAARVILRNLARRPVKAFLSMFGIALAVALLVVGFYFFDAIDRIIEVQFRYAQREDVLVVFNEPRPARARHDLAHLPGVMRVETFRAVPARLRFEHRTYRTALIGVEPASDLRRIVDRDFRTFEPPPDGLILATKLAEILGVSVGESVRVEALEGERAVRQVAVTGTVDDLIGLSAYMDARALNRLLREGETISGAYLMVDGRETARLYALLKRTPSVSGVSIPEAALASFNETIARTVGASTTVIIVFACVIAFGMVYNGARIALSERGRELASLRVLGFTQGEVGTMLLGEQAILTLIAVPVGYGVGYGLCALITRAVASDLYRLPLVVSARTYALSSIVVAGAALLSGLLVRWRLRRLDLISVLKTRE